MNFFQFFLILVFLFLAFPIGNYLAKITSLEVKQGKIWFVILTMLSLFGFVFFLFLKNLEISISLLFICLVTYQSLKKSARIKNLF